MSVLFKMSGHCSRRQSRKKYNALFVVVVCFEATARKTLLCALCFVKQKEKDS